jgi:hypothetical protein
MHFSAPILLFTIVHDAAALEHNEVAEQALAERILLELQSIRGDSYSIAPGPASNLGGAFCAEAGRGAHHIASGPAAVEGVEVEQSISGDEFGMLVQDVASLGTASARICTWWRCGGFLLWFAVVSSLFIQSPSLLVVVWWCSGTT